MSWRGAAACGAIVSLVVPALAALLHGQPQPHPASPQGSVDAEYTRIIRQNLDDPRITTELVDHLPSSDTVPTPLAFFGRVVGTPGELTYARDIARYYRALASASPRARVFTIGTSEEGREIVMLAIANADIVSSLDSYRDRLGALTDPRRTTDAEAADLVSAARPIYWITGGMHSPETGGPETLIELAYRLIVEETPLIRSIRANVITLITPVLEVDGRERQVDTYYINRRRAPGDVRLPLVYWGQYVAHDNNRDGIGQFLQLTQAVTRTALDWHPTILHDLHETQSYLYVSTGTGPYNPELDPIVPHEWWTLADNDLRELTRRGVPGAWTYAYYDGWMPNYMFFIAHTHNAIGRFYEVQGYGPDPYTVRADKARTTREWYRPLPPDPVMKWGPRNTVNLEQSALLLSLQYVAGHRETVLDDYWLKNRRAVEKGRTDPPFAWVIPSGQRRAADAADAVNDLRRQGLEISVASTTFRTASIVVNAGDYVVRADQPFRTLAAMYFAIQQFPSKAQPYDDTGWTFQLLRDVSVVPVNEPSIQKQPMTLLAHDAKARGGVLEGAGPVLVVEDTSDTHLATLRFRNPAIKMAAAERDFEIPHAGGPLTYRAGSIFVAGAARAALEPQLAALGLSARALPSMPAVATHDLDVPRVGLVHSWTRTQDEGWWRAAFDRYAIPYDYFSDQQLARRNLRASYDVIVFPNVGGSRDMQLNGLPMSGSAPLPYRPTAEAPNLSRLDASDDIRGGMGQAGLQALATFVRQGGTLLAEGSTAALLAASGVFSGIAAESPETEPLHGAIVRGMFADRQSPIAYGYDGPELPVYFNQQPVLSVDAQAASAARVRVVMRFPDSAGRLVMSGALGNGARLAGTPLVIDQRLGSGHVVIYALRPFWRWQTHGAYPLVFNAIMNWNDLDAGQQP
jgi:hypothetical protein